MNTPRGEETIFAEALRLPPEERAAYLDQSTGGNAELRRRVESLLGSYGAGDFLEHAAGPQFCPTAHVSTPITEKPGGTIGRYKLLQQIGEGGCGVVYMAEQAEPLRRRVALKVIKLGMDTKSVIARFEAERQALAMMDHPNIAKVLDAGATEMGRPYFVMELVRGMKITEFCDEKELSTRARLDLFIQVCQAIQHAHQKGTIHRDIKPSNILVTVNDGVAVPKVIDFGIAKATNGQQLTDKTLFTAFEQFVGTPAYMSPEQAMLTSLDIDTRSDIYALGVLLYELLTGKTPFDAKELMAIGLDEMRRAIRDQEPPRPSTRLSTLAQNELSTAAQRRGLDAPKLVSELRGDLDWIVMKALEKDRARRYETASGLAADIQRHLDNEPVVACPPSRLYRFQKTVRRNKLAFVTASAVGMSLAIGLTLSTALLLREQEARQRAREQAARAGAVNEFLRRDLLGQADSGFQAQEGFKPDPNLTVREALERAAKRIGDRFKNQPYQQSMVRYTIGSALRGLGEAERAIPHLQRALELRGALGGRDDANTLGMMNELASAYDDAGKFDQALTLYLETLELAKAKLGPRHQQTLGVMHNLGMLYEKLGKLDQAVSLFEQVLELGKATVGLEHRDILNAMNGLASAYNQAGRRDQALALFEETLRLTQSKLGPNDPFTQNAMRNVALAYRARGRHEQALPLFEKALELRKATMASDYPDMGLFTANLAEAYETAGRRDLALPLWEDTVKLMTNSLGLDHTNTATAMRFLATAYEADGRFELALPLRQERLRIKQAKSGPSHPDTLEAMFRVGRCFEALKKYPEAEAVYRDARSRFQALASNAPPREIPVMGAILQGLADVLRERKRPSEARSIAEEAANLYRRHAKWPSKERVQALGVLEAILKEIEDSRALKAVRLEILEAFRAAAQKDHGWALNGLAWRLATSSDSSVRDGKHAVELAEKAVAKTKRNQPEELDTLAAAFAETGEFAKAVTTQKQAIALLHDEKVKEDFESRLGLYQSNSPYRAP